MSRNPYLDDLAENYVPEDFDVRSLGILAIAHELREANSLTEAINAPSRFVLGTQDPISPEDLGAQMRSSKIMAIPDDSDDARIAEAARDLVERYKSEGAIAKDVLSDLVETVERTRR